MCISNPKWTKCFVTRFDRLLVFFSLLVVWLDNSLFSRSLVRSLTRSITPTEAAGLKTINCFLSLFFFNTMHNMFPLPFWANEAIAVHTCCVRFTIYDNDFNDIRCALSLRANCQSIQVLSMKRNFCVAFFQWTHKQTTEKNIKKTYQKSNKNTNDSFESLESQ